MCLVSAGLVQQERLCVSLADLFSCFNGGECVHPALCDCRRFNATGPRCQLGRSDLSSPRRDHGYRKGCRIKTTGMTLTDLEPTSLQHDSHTDLGSLCPVLVYNVGPERDSICRAWGQHHVETFDGLYYYFSGKSSYVLVGYHEPEGQSFSIQVRPPLSFPAGPCRLQQDLGASRGWNLLILKRLEPSLSTFPSSYSRTVFQERATVSKPLLTQPPWLPLAAPDCPWPFTSMAHTVLFF